MSPVDYGLCRQTVTVYRLENGQLQRLVVENCYLHYEDTLERDAYGQRHRRRFLLVMPGSCQRVFVGDRIYDGIGPETVQWEQFVPAAVPGLCQAEYVRPFFWGGSVCHVEAGRK